MTHPHRYPTEYAAREMAFRLNLQAEMEGWPQRYVAVPRRRRWIVKARWVGGVRD